MHEIDNSVAARILRRPDRAILETELSKYNAAAQRRWVANPALEWLLQTFLGDVTRGARQTIPAESAEKAGPAKPNEEKPAAPEPDTESDAEEGIFAMFD
jgi:hypothetical protein